MILIRILLAIICLIFFIWFAVPLSLSVNLSIGNATGIGICIMLFMYVLFMPHINNVIAVWQLHKVKKWIYRGIIGLIILIISLVIIETTCIIRAINNKPTDNATVVVLGCRVYGDRPSLSMQERVMAAYNYLMENEHSVCILSGGKGIGENISEAECMYNYLIDLGIEPERLFKEDKSTTTRENLIFSKKLIEDNGLNPYIAIATSEYHEYRAGKIARSLGMEYGSVPAKTAVWLFPTYYIRELYAILYEWVF